LGFLKRLKLFAFEATHRAPEWEKGSGFGRRRWREAVNGATNVIAAGGGHVAREEPPAVGGGGSIGLTVGKGIGGANSLICLEGTKTNEF